LFILRPDNLGDLVIFSGCLKYIRKAYPNAQITICVKKYAVNLLEHCPYIDEIVIWEHVQKTMFDDLPEFKGRWRLMSLIKYFRIFKLTLFKPEYDLFLLPLRSPTIEMHQFAKFIRSKRKVFVDDRARKTLVGDQQLQKLYTHLHVVEETREFDHELNIYRDFLRSLGIDKSEKELHPEIFTTANDREWANKHLHSSGQSISLAICPGVTSKPEKFYAAANYRKALSQFQEITFSVYILGSKGEMEQCKQVERALSDCKQVASIQNIAGETTIRQLAECIRLCDITISNETGALHIATALNKPTIGILGGGHFGRFYPWGDPEINLTAHLPMDCYFCNWNCIYPTMKCIHDIEPEVISNKLSQLLETLGKQNAHV